MSCLDMTCLLYRQITITNFRPKLNKYEVINQM